LHFLVIKPTCSACLPYHCNKIGFYLQPGYYPPENRPQGQLGFARAQLAPPAADEWDPYARQGGAPAYQPQPGGGAPGSTQYPGPGAGRSTAGAYNPALQQPVAGQYRPQPAPAAYQQSGPPQYQGGTPAASGAGYNRPGDAYYPDGPANGAASLNSLKQTLAQTISNLAAASASSGPSGGASSGGYAPAGYDTYAGAGRAPVASQQPYAQAQNAAPYADPARSYAPAATGRPGGMPAAQGRYNPEPAAAPYNAGGPSRAAANLVPLDVRYQAAAGATATPQLQQLAQGGGTRYVPSAAPAAEDRGYVPAGGYQPAASQRDPPNTAGYYNRRPAQDPALGPQGKHFVFAGEESPQ
jgi:hypothetical protein